MERLRFLDMSNNGIEVIKGKSFHRVANVERLILNNNEIELNGIGIHHPRSVGIIVIIMFVIFDTKSEKKLWCN